MEVDEAPAAAPAAPAPAPPEPAQGTGDMTAAAAAAGTEAEAFPLFVGHRRRLPPDAELFESGNLEREALARQARRRGLLARVARLGCCRCSPPQQAACLAAAALAGWRAWPRLPLPLLPERPCRTLPHQAAVAAAHDEPRQMALEAGLAGDPLLAQHRFECAQVRGSRGQRVAACVAAGCCPTPCARALTAAAAAPVAPPPALHLPPARSA